MVDELLERQESMHPQLVNGYISDLTLVQYGIPQGSLLGPRLYTIYIMLTTYLMLSHLEMYLCMQMTRQYIV